jgi:hypothetical protein
MKIKKTKTEKTQYSEDCSICKREIKGFSESAMLYNMQVHLDRTHQLKQRDIQRILTDIKESSKDSQKEEVKQ